MVKFLKVEDEISQLKNKTTKITYLKNKGTKVTF